MPAADDGGRRADVAVAAGLAVAMGLVAIIWREPRYVTDRDVYQQIGRQLVVPDCSSLHCTRVLVAWLLEHAPLPSLVSWKLYAVCANTLAAFGVARLCRWFGLPSRVSWLAAVLVAFGRGSQLTLLDPYTSDPLIYALTPWLVYMLGEGHIVAVAVMAAVGVFAKEFAAGPLWIFTVYGALIRRRDVVLACGCAALAVSLLWVTFQLFVVLRFNYSYGGNPSSQLLGGGYLVTWIHSLGWLHAGASLAVHLAPILLLAAFGYRRAPGLMQQLTLACLPPAVLLCYVQQPDRALWNFEWLIVPLAVIVLDRQAPWLISAFVGSYIIVNLPALPETSIRLLIVPFAVCLGAAMLMVRRAPRQPPPISANRALPPLVSPQSLRLAIGGVVALGIVSVLEGVLAGDIAVHRAIERTFGVNVWGYRGPVAKSKRADEIRVVLLGGREMFGGSAESSIPARLDTYLNVPWMRRDSDYHATVPMTAVNLASPYDRVQAFPRTLQDYATLQYDVVCLYIGHDDPVPSPDAASNGWRRQSAVFRATGYLPVFPLVWTLKSPLDDVSKAEDAVPALDWPDYREALEASIDYGLSGGKRVLVATHPLLDRAEAQRQDEAARWLGERFAGNRAFRYQDLRRVVDVDAPNLDGYIAESLTQNVFRLLNQ